MEAETRKIMGRLNPTFKKFNVPVSALSGGQRQSVAIAPVSYTHLDVYKRQALDAIPGASKFSGGEKGVEMNAILLNPTPITKATLNLAIDAGHISKEAACEGALPDVAACQ